MTIRLYSKGRAKPIFEIETESQPQTSFKVKSESIQKRYGIKRVQIDNLSKKIREFLEIFWPKNYFEKMT